MSLQLVGQTIYKPKIIDPLSEPWRWNRFPEVEGAGVRCMTETKSGKLYFGANHGVLSYDGINWQEIDHDSMYGDMIVNNLYVDNNEHIYAATDSGLLCHTIKGWSRIFPKEIIPKISKLYKVKSIKQLSDSSLLINTGQTFYSGLLHIKKNKITFYSSRSTIKSLRKQNLEWDLRMISDELIDDKGFYVEDFFVDDDNTIWGVSAPEKQHIKVFHFAYDTTTSTFKTLAVYSKEHGIRNAYRNRIFKNNNEIWIINGVHNVGINRFDGKQWNYIEPDKRICDDFLHTSIMKSKDETIWIGGLNIIYTIKEGKWQAYKNPEYMLPNARFELFEDSKGYLWIMGKQKELFRVDYASKQWKTYKNLNYQAESKNGKTYFLSIDGKVIVNDTTSWYTLDENNLPNQPTKLFISSNNDIWVSGSHNKIAAISHYNGKEWRLQLYPELSWGIDARSVFEDISGNIWFGASVDNNVDIGQKAGVICYRRQGNSYKVKHFEGRESTFMYNAYGIGQSKDGRIWVGGSHLASFDGTNWNQYYKPVERFQHQECISNTTNGKMWVGSRFYGVFSFDGENWENYSLDQGLYSNNIISILPISDNNVWVATDKDICRYDGINWTTNIFTKQMTLTREGGSLVFGKDSSLWINKALREWNRRTLTTNKIDNIIRENFYSYNYNPDKKLPETNIVTKLETSSYKSSIVIEWTGKDYFNWTPSEKLTFSYRLNNGAWSPFTEKTYLTYWGLPDGSYTFEVRARDLDFNIDATPAMINFIVLPPIWKQLWFIFLIAFFILIVGVYQWRIFNRNRHLAKLNLKLAAAKQKLEIQKGQIIDQNYREIEIMNAKMRFFTNISHEFRTPLTLISGTIHRLINHNYDANEASKNENLKAIERNSNRLLELINQLMDFRKLESGEMLLHTTLEDIVCFLEVIYNNFKYHAEENGIELLFNKTIEQLYVQIDKDKLEKILLNLISNAVKNTPRGGKIAIILNKESVNFSISICDTGIGISEAEIEKIFDPFYQVPSDKATGAVGTGIGLSYVKSLIELHAGSISVKSSKADKRLVNNEYRTCFEVRLPIQSHNYATNENTPNSQELSHLNAPSKNKDEILSDQQEAIKPIKKIKSTNAACVLFVDDNRELRQFVKQSLETEFRVELAVNGEEGLEKAIDLLPDIIVSDIMMPISDGIELCNAIKNDERVSHIPIILLTARSTEEHHIEGYAVGADDYLVKPFSIALLCARIHNLIGIRKKLQQQFGKHFALNDSMTLKSDIDSQFMQKVIGLINTNLNDPQFSVEVLSAEIGLSSRHLLNKIQTLTDYTPVELIRIIRLKKATELLREQNLNITEVAYDVGFSSPGYFTKCFHKQYGISPKEYATKISDKSTNLE